jgi:hypothetical protein
LRVAAWIAVIGETPASTSITRASCISRAASAWRVRTFLENAARFDEAADELVGFFIADFGASELLGGVALEQLVIGGVGHRANRGGEIGVGVVEDFVTITWPRIVLDIGTSCPVPTAPIARPDI